MAKRNEVKVNSEENTGGIDQDAINSALAAGAEKKSKKSKKVEAEILNELMGSAEEVRNAEKVSIIIRNQGGPGGQDPVFVSVNGMGYQIPREKPVSIPKPILQALENAVEIQYFREEKDGRQIGPVLERKVPRFTLSGTSSIR